MSWRDPIEFTAESIADASLRQNISTPFGARVYGIDTLVDRAAADVDRELLADCDPPALARATARLALCLAFKALGPKKVST